MNDFFLPLLTIILTLFFLMICGYVCRKKNIITSTSSKGLSQLIISVGQPMMIIGALAKAEYTEENVTTAWQVVVISTVMHILMALMAFLICRLLKKHPDENKIFEFSLVFANAGFIGFPILDAVFGDGIGSFMGAFYVISFHIFLWIWGIMILARGREDIKLTPKKAILNYGTVPCLIGVVIFFLKGIVPLPDDSVLTPIIQACGQFLTYLGGLCTPISVLVTGSLLATISLPKMFTNAKLYLHSAIKLIGFPVVLCLIAKAVFALLAAAMPNALSPQTVEIYILLVAAMAGVPSAATITMLAELYDIEPGYASQTVGITSILSTVTLPLIMLFAQWVVQW